MRTAPAVRGAPVLLAALLAGLELLAAPGRGVAVLGLVAVAAALLAAALPGGLLPSAVLLVLVLQHLVATASAPAVPRVLAAGALGAGLWCLHALFDLAAAVPLRADVDRSVPLRWLRRQGAVLAVAVPVALVAGAAGALAPGSGAGPWAGLLAAAGVVALPVLLLTGRRR